MINKKKHSALLVALLAIIAISIISSIGLLKGGITLASPGSNSGSDSAIYTTKEGQIELFHTGAGGGYGVDAATRDTQAVFIGLEIEPIYNMYTTTSLSSYLISDRIGLGSLSTMTGVILKDLPISGGMVEDWKANSYQQLRVENNTGNYLVARDFGTAGMSTVGRTELFTGKNGLFTINGSVEDFKIAVGIDDNAGVLTLGREDIRDALKTNNFSELHVFNGYLYDPFRPLQGSNAYLVYVPYYYYKGMSSISDTYLGKLVTLSYMRGAIARYASSASWESFGYSMSGTGSMTMFKKNYPGVEGSTAAIKGYMSKAANGTLTSMEDRCMLARLTSGLLPEAVGLGSNFQLKMQSIQDQTYGGTARSLYQKYGVYNVGDNLVAGNKLNDYTAEGLAEILHNSTLKLIEEDLCRLDETDEGKCSVSSRLLTARNYFRDNIEEAYEVLDWLFGDFMTNTTPVTGSEGVVYWLRNGDTLENLSKKQETFLTSGYVYDASSGTDVARGAKATEDALAIQRYILDSDTLSASDACLRTNNMSDEQKDATVEFRQWQMMGAILAVFENQGKSIVGAAAGFNLKIGQIDVFQYTGTIYSQTDDSEYMDNFYKEAASGNRYRNSANILGTTVISSPSTMYDMAFEIEGANVNDKWKVTLAALDKTGYAIAGKNGYNGVNFGEIIRQALGILKSSSVYISAESNKTATRGIENEYGKDGTDNIIGTIEAQTYVKNLLRRMESASRGYTETVGLLNFINAGFKQSGFGATPGGHVSYSFKIIPSKDNLGIIGNTDVNIGKNFGGSLLDANATYGNVGNYTQSNINTSNFDKEAFIVIGGKKIPNLNSKVMQKLSFEASTAISRYNASDVLQLSTWTPKINANKGINASGKVYDAMSGAASDYSKRMRMDASYNSILTQRVHNEKSDTYSRGAATTRWFMYLNYVRIHREKNCDVSLVLGFEDTHENNKIKHEVGISGSDEYPDLVLGLSINNALLETLKDKNKAVTLDIVMESGDDGKGNKMLSYVGKRDEKAKINTINSSLFSANCFAWSDGGSTVGGFGSLLIDKKLLDTVPVDITIKAQDSTDDTGKKASTAYTFSEVYKNTTYDNMTITAMTKPSVTYSRASKEVKSINLSELYRNNEFTDAANYNSSNTYDFEIDRWNISSFAEEESSTELQFERAYTMGAEVMIRIKDLETNEETVCYYEPNDEDEAGNKITTLPSGFYKTGTETRIYTTRTFGQFAGRYVESKIASDKTNMYYLAFMHKGANNNVADNKYPSMQLAPDSAKTSTDNTMWFRVKNVPAAPIIAKGSVVYADDGQHIKSDITVGEKIGTDGVLSISLEWSMDEELNEKQITLDEYIKQLEDTGLTTIAVRVTEDIARDQIYNVVDSDGNCEEDSDGWLTGMVDKLKVNGTSNRTVTYTLEEFKKMLDNKEQLVGDYTIPSWNDATAAHKSDGASATKFHDSTAVKVAYGYDINIIALDTDTIKSSYPNAVKGGSMVADATINTWMTQDVCYDILGGEYISLTADDLNAIEIGESREALDEHECYLIAGAYEFQPEPIFVRTHSTIEEEYLPLSYGTVKEGNYSSGSVVPAQSYNVLTGVPSTSKLYFTSGGSEFIVELTLVEIKGETAARTYTSYFASRACKFSYGDTSSAGGGTTTTVNKQAISHDYNNESAVGTLTDSFNIAVPVDYTSATYTVPQHGGTKIIAVWTGTIANNTADPGVEGIEQPVDNITAGGTHYTGMPGQMIKTGQEVSGGSYVWDVSEYNSDLEKAYNWGLAVEQASATPSGNVQTTSDSDHATRRWHAGNAVIDIRFNNVNSLNNGNSDYYHTAAHEATLANTVVNTSNWATMKLITNDTRLGSGYFESYGHAEALSCSSCMAGSAFSRSGRYDEGITDTWNYEVSLNAYTPTTINKEVIASYSCSITGDESSGYSHSASPVKQIVSYDTCWCGYDQGKNLRDATECSFSQSDSPEEITIGTDPITGKDIKDTIHHYSYTHTAHNGNTAISHHTCYANHSVSAWKETVTRKAPDLTYTITVTFTGSYVDGIKGTDGYAQKVSTADSVYEAHCCCGPCCQHVLPAESDNWMQYITYDYVAIEDISVWKIYRSYVKGLNPITYDYDNTDHLLGKVESGDPNIWYNIGDMNLVYRDHLLYGAKQEASAAGRIRYSVQAQQLDDVIWSEKNTAGISPKVLEARPGDCDGQASTIKTNGVYVEAAGHNLTYALGNLYARTVNRTGVNLGTNDADASYIGDVYSDMISSVIYTYDDTTYTNRYYLDNPDTANHKDVFTNTDNWIDSLGTTRIKSGYENASTDARDLNTLEFARWKTRRNTQVTAYVASDLLVLQDSFGDRKIVYADNSATADTEQNIKGITMSAEDALLTQAEECIDPDYFDTDWFTKDKLLGGYIGTGNTNSGVTGKMFTGGSSTRVETVLDTDTSKEYVASITHTDPDASVTPPRISFKTVARVDDSRNPADYKSSACLGQLRMVRPNGLRIGIQNVQISPITLNGLYQSEIAIQSWFNILRWTDTSSIAKDYELTPQFEGESDPILGNDLYLQEAYYYDSELKPKVNNVVIHTPISNTYTFMRAYAGPMNDQRIEGDRIITTVDALGYCPGTAESCEYSFLNCKYGVRTAVFANKFDEGTYENDEGTAIQIIDTLRGLSVFVDKTAKITADSTGNNRMILTAGSLGGVSIDIPVKNIELKYTSTLEYTVNMTYNLPNVNADTILVSAGNIKLYTKAGDSNNLYLCDGDGCEYRYACSPAFSDKQLSLKISYAGLANCEVTLNGTKLTGEIVAGGSTNIQEAETSNYLSIGSSRNTVSLQVDNIVIYREAGSTSHTAGCYTTKITHETHDNYLCDTPVVLTAGVEGAQTFTAPVSGYYMIECYGAQGAYGYSEIGAQNLGGYAYGKIYLSAGQKIYAYVGKYGTRASQPDASGSFEETGVRLAGGGWNGGGDASYGGYGGGGMTYVSLIGTDKKTTETINYTVDNNGTPENLQAVVGAMSMNKDGVLVLANGGAGATTSLENIGMEKLDEEAYEALLNLGKEFNYSYTGNVQTFTAPYNGEYKLEVWGAQGGTSSGGQGGYTTGTVILEKGTKLYVYVGSQGSGGSGGWNGGGTNYEAGYGGGGATDISILSGNWNNLDRLKSRIMVAGGGGGYNATGGNGGGAGGGLTGANGGGSEPGYGGTQTSGGGVSTSCMSNYGPAGFGYGGSGNWAGESLGAGGGGYYGGGVGGGGNDNGSGGGGSSYVSGYNGCDTTYLASQKLNGENLQFNNVTLQRGGNTGNGKAKITYVNYTDEIKTSGKGKVTDFGYTGTVQQFQAPADGIYLLEAWGASGGAGTSGDTSMVGFGGYTSGLVALQKGETIQVLVGKAGGQSTGSGESGGSPAPATFGGGGDGGVTMGSQGYHLGGSGGGATDFRVGGLTYTGASEYDSRMSVVQGTSFKVTATVDHDCLPAGPYGRYIQIDVQGTGLNKMSGLSTCSSYGQTYKKIFGSDTHVTYLITKPVGYEATAVNMGLCFSSTGSIVDTITMTSLESRILVAGGGGGQGCASSHNRGNGGGLVGATTFNTGDYYGASASGGSQTAGGASVGNYKNTGSGNGQGSFGLGAAARQCAAGGGGGYYGGGSEYTAGGGGGSSYIAGYVGCDTTYHKATYQGIDGRLISLANGNMVQGNNSGNGRARITQLAGGSALTKEQEALIGNVQTFTVSGSYTIPVTGVYEVTAFGGQGGGTNHGGASGGQGGTSKRYMYLEEGQVVSFTVGAQGTNCASCSTWSDYYYNSCPDHSGSVWYGTEWNCSGGSGGATNILVDGASVGIANGGGGGHSSRDDGGSSHCHPYTSKSTGGAGGASIANTGTYPSSITFDDVTYTSKATSGGNTGAGKVTINLMVIDEEQYVSFDDSLPTTGETAGYVNAKENEGYRLGQGENYSGHKSVGGAGAGYYGGRVNSTTGEVGYGSSYITKNANTGASVPGVNVGNGQVVITLMEHTHTASCRRDDNTYNNHVHSASCICGDTASYEALEREVAAAVYGGSTPRLIQSMLNLKQGSTTVASVIDKAKNKSISFNDCMKNIISIIGAQSSATLDSLDMFDDRNNPIFACYNHNDVHICSDNCVTESILTCTEPHHSGGHYDKGNEICYDACNDDNKHKSVKDMQGIDASEVGTRIQADDYFTIHWDNVGDFYDGTANGVRYGASIEDQRRGQGYNNGMDTTSWIRSKVIRFLQCDVLFYNEHTGLWEEYSRGEDIYLPITTDGIPGNGDDDLKRDWRTRDQSNIAVTEYKFYLLLDNEEVMGTTYYAWTTALNDAGSNTAKSTPYIKGNGVNDSNPDSTNKARMDAGSNYSSYSACFNWNEFDIVGHIGNLLVTYANDFRYMNFFKKTTDEYLVEPFIFKIVEDEQTNYLGIGITESGVKGTSNYSYYLSDVRSREVKKETGYYNTWDTQSWNEKANPVDNILSSDVRTIYAVEGQEMPLGYEMFAEITTIGDYNTVKIKPSIYVLDTETGEVMIADVWTKSSSGYKLIYLAGTDENDIANMLNYGMKSFTGEKYSLIRNATFESNYMYVALGDEKRLRNVTDDEIKRSQELADMFFPSVMIDDSNELYEKVTIGESNERVTELKSTIGNTNLIEIGGKQRLFIGSSKVRAEVFNGQNDTNFENKIMPELFETQARRWLFTIGLPENSYVVPYTSKYANGRHMNPNYILEDGTDAIKDILYTQESLDNNRYYVLYAIDTIALGDVWNLEYEAFEQAQTIKVDGRSYTLPSTIPDVIAVMDLDMEEQDFDIIRTH